MIPMAKMKLVMAGYPIANPRQNKMIPQAEANIVILTINLPISFDKGDSSLLALAAKVAICPIKCPVSSE